MNQRIFDYLSRMPHFSILPTDVREKIADSAVEETHPEGKRYAEQGHTKIDSIFIVEKGVLSLFDEKTSANEPTGFIKPGEVFGGITILLNGGISLRTVIVKETCTGFKVPKEIFQDLCTRFKSFYEYFLVNFSKNIFDASLASIIETGQTKHFLSGVVPFSFLPPEEIETAVSQLTMVHYPRDTILFVQGRTRIGYLYILQKGAAERYYEDSKKKTMLEILGEGDIYGGISMLLNDGISVRTMRVTEDSFFYLLPNQPFIDICNRNDAFTEYFTDIFGRRMLEKSYAAIIANTMRAKEQGLQFFNQPVSGIYTRKPIFGSIDMTIQEAAQLMGREKISSIFLKTAIGKCVGVVTERDLTRKVIASGLDVKRPVAEIMSSPVRMIPDQALVIEALLMMMREDIRHLAVMRCQRKCRGDTVQS